MAIYSDRQGLRVRVVIGLLSFLVVGAGISDSAEKLHSVIPDIGPLGWLDSPNSDLIQRIAKLRIKIDPLADVQGLIVGGKEIWCFSVDDTNSAENAYVRIAWLNTTGAAQVKELTIPIQIFWNLEKLWRSELERASYRDNAIGKELDMVSIHLFSYADGKQLAGYFPVGEYGERAPGLMKILDVVGAVSAAKGTSTEQKIETEEELARQLRKLFISPVGEGAKSNDLLPE